MGVEVLAKDVEGRCNIFGVLGDDVEVSVGLNETTWGSSNSGCGILERAMKCEEEVGLQPM